MNEWSGLSRRFSIFYNASYTRLRIEQLQILDNLIINSNPPQISEYPSTIKRFILTFSKYILGIKYLLKKIYINTLAIKCVWRLCFTHYSSALLGFDSAGLHPHDVILDEVGDFAYAGDVESLGGQALGSVSVNFVKEFQSLEEAHKLYSDGLRGSIVWSYGINLKEKDI